MIYDEIKKANVTAMKEKDSVARAILGVVITKGMLETVEKRKTNEELTDADMVRILQKTLKELSDEKESYEKLGKQEQAQEIEKQKEVISKFLPKLLSEQEVYDIIDKQTDKSIPNIMKFFKSNYASKVDMAVVSSVLKKFN